MHASTLNSELVLKRSEVLDAGTSGAHKLGVTRPSRVSLQANLSLTALLGSELLVLVLLDALQEVLTALGLLHMLDANVDSLLHDTVSDLLVDFHTNGTGGNTPDDAGSTVVELVGHTLLDGGVGNNINVVSNLEGGHVGLERGHTMLAEGAREEVSGVASVTVGARHVRG